MENGRRTPLAASRPATEGRRPEASLAGDAVAASQRAGRRRGGGAGGTGGTGGARSVDRTRLCKFYIEGRCRRGKACAFAHGEEELALPQQERKKQLCIDFFRVGRCRLGAACRYAHSAEEVDGRAAQGRAPDSAGQRGPAPAERRLAPTNSPSAPAAEEEAPPEQILASMHERIAKLQAQLEVLQSEAGDSATAGEALGEPQDTFGDKTPEPGGLHHGSASFGFSRQTTAEGVGSTPHDFSRQSTEELAASFPFSRGSTEEAEAAAIFGRRSTELEAHRLPRDVAAAEGHAPRAAVRRCAPEAAGSSHSVWP